MKIQSRSSGWIARGGDNESHDTNVSFESTACVDVSLRDFL